MAVAVAAAGSRTLLANAGARGSWGDMMRTPGHALVQNGSPAAEAEPQSDGAVLQALQELWFVLAQRRWSSLVIVPAGEEGSASELARTLAEIGKNLSDVPVSAVSVRLLAPGSARALAALANHLRDGQRRLRSRDTIEVGPMHRNDRDEDHVGPIAGQVIVCVPPVVAEPLSLAVAQAADAVVLKIELGKTRMRDIRRSMSLIGRDRIAGCILV